jgi:hypothetical protein
LKLSSIQGLTQNVARVASAVNAAVTKAKRREIPRERAFRLFSVFRAMKFAPCTTTVVRARRPIRIVYQSRIPGVREKGLKSVQSGWKK